MLYFLTTAKCFKIIYYLLSAHQVQIILSIVIPADSWDPGVFMKHRGDAQRHREDDPVKMLEFSVVVLPQLKNARS